MTTLDWPGELAALAAPLDPAAAQALLPALAPLPGEPCRPAWRRALLRLAMLHRCVDPEAPASSLTGVAAVLDALEDGLELRDVYASESAFNAALEDDEPARWLEAAALAERGRCHWRGLADVVNLGALERLVTRGLIHEARALLPRVRWRQHTVSAITALWPYGDAADRAAWLDYAEAVVVDPSFPDILLPDIYSVEHRAALVVLTASEPRLAALTAQIAALPPEDHDPSLGFDDPRLSLALARQACGHHDAAWAGLAAEPPGWLRWHAAVALLPQAPPAARAALLSEAWTTLLDWGEEGGGGCAQETLALDPDAGAPHALRWLAAALRADDDRLQGLTGLLALLPPAAREQAAAQLAAAVPRLSGSSLLVVLTELHATCPDHLTPAVRRQLAAEAPEPVTNAWWWFDAAHLLPPEPLAPAADRLLPAFDAAEHYYDRDALGNALLAIYNALPAALQPSWAPLLAARHARFYDATLPDAIQALIPPADLAALIALRRAQTGAFHDRLVLERLLHSLAGALPAPALLPLLPRLTPHLSNPTRAADRLCAEAWDAPLAPPLTGPIASSARAAWDDLLRRPGPFPWGASATLLTLAVCLEGLEVGVGMLEDALAWAEALP